MANKLNAVIFDLDDTLVATSMLEEYRKNKDKEGLLENLPQSRLYGPVREILASIIKKGIPLGLVTNSPRWYVDEVLKHHDIDVFNAKICFDDVAPNGLKPRPDGLIKVLKLLGLEDSKNVIYIGDKGTDFVAAYHVAIRPIAPSWASREPMDVTPAAIMNSETLIDNLGDFDEFSLAADRTAGKESFDYPKKQLNFLPINEQGNLVALDKDKIRIVALGRYFSKTSNLAYKLHSIHPLSKEICKKDESDDYEIPSYYIELLSKSVESLALFMLEKEESFDVVTVIPAKQGKNTRLEGMLRKMQDHSKTSALYIADLMLFSEGAKSLKTLGGKQARVDELNNKLFIQEKYLGTLKGKKVLVIDDVTTTAATFSRSFELLEGQGAAFSMGLCLAKTVSMRDFEDKLCTACGRVMQVLTNGATGIQFYSCTGYFEQKACKKTENIPMKDCPLCGKVMYKRMNNKKRTHFLACSGWNPKNKHSCNHAEGVENL
jgi:FMN phosphatase YigB (HAD superfamily)